MTAFKRPLIQELINGLIEVLIIVLRLSTEQATGIENRLFQMGKGCDYIVY